MKLVPLEALVVVAAPPVVRVAAVAVARSVAHVAVVAAVGLAAKIMVLLHPRPKHSPILRSAPVLRMVVRAVVVGCLAAA